MNHYKDHPEYEDAKQEAEMLYFEKGLNYDALGKEKWINRTVYLLIRNYIRKNSHCDSLSYISETCGVNYIEFDSYYAIIEYPDIVENLTFETLFDKLTQDEKKLLQLFLEGYSYSELSDIFDTNCNNIRQKIFKIRHKLRLNYYTEIA
jgi:RNA polymerase sigma factor (sigma-70 family)